MAERLRLIGGAPQGDFVCPWCGARFERRYIASDGIHSLEEHWRRRPGCSKNRGTNNPTQTKYDIVDADDHDG